MKQRVAVTGATGLIGSRFCELLKNRFNIIPFSSAELDITDTNKINSVLSTTPFDTLLHFAAYTNVDGAETEREKAYNINVNGTRNLKQYLSNNNKQFIHISTDFVFDGSKPPYSELSIPHPIGYYGETKYLAEKEVENIALIVRISYPYGFPGGVKPDFVQRIISLLKKSQPFQMTSDSLMTPTFIDDIVNGLAGLIEEKKQTGIIHLIGPESLSPFDAGKKIAQTFGYDTALIEPTTYEAYMKDRALRPQHGMINSIYHYSSQFHSFSSALTLIKQAI